MPKTKAEIQKALGLSERPDDEHMALLEELGEGEVVTGVTPLTGPGYSAEERAEELGEAVVADSVGDLLWRWRLSPASPGRSATLCASFSRPCAPRGRERSIPDATERFRRTCEMPGDFEGDHPEGSRMTYRKGKGKVLRFS